MNKRIKDKIQDIKIYLEQLSKIKPNTFEEYEKDFKTKAACERYFEKIAEAVLDLALLIIKEKNLQTPEEENEAFEILEKENIMNSNLTKKLKGMRGMRNIIAHQYSDVNDELIYTAISKEIEDDVKAFLEIIKKLNKK